MVRTAFVLAVIVQLSACAGPSYYLQAISGHLGLMRQTTDINQILASGLSDQELERDLQLALEIRSFATDQLGLPDNGSYTGFVQTGQRAVSWNVVAAPEFSIQARQWCFMVTGCVPYRGYFDQQKAQRFAKKLQDQAYDVTVSPAIAYSTLGWFEDPLLDTMLQYGDEQLAAFIFHELAHQQLYVKGDTGFNEAYAGFVEETGVREWLRSTGRDEFLPRWRALNAASIEFNALLRKTRGELDDLYNSGRGEQEMRSGKREILFAMESAYRSLVDDQWGGQNYFQAWFSRGLNNARLALMNSYQGGSCAFQNLYQSAGGNMQKFQRLAADRAALAREERAVWLEQRCEAIASGGDL